MSSDSCGSASCWIRPDSSTSHAPFVPPTLVQILRGASVLRTELQSCLIRRDLYTILSATSADDSLLDVTTSMIIVLFPSFPHLPPWSRRLFLSLACWSQRVVRRCHILSILDPLPSVFSFLSDGGLSWIWPGSRVLVLLGTFLLPSVLYCFDLYLSFWLVPIDHQDDARGV